MTDVIVQDSPMWNWFGLSYASYLVLPRVLLCEIPTELQQKLYNVLQEIEPYHKDIPVSAYQFTVQMRDERGRFIKSPWAPYRRRTMADVRKVLGIE